VFRQENGGDNGVIDVAVEGGEYEGAFGSSCVPMYLAM